MFGKLFRKLLGIKELDTNEKYEIEPDMPNPDVLLLNIENMKQSPVVQSEMQAAKDFAKENNH